MADPKEEAALRKLVQQSWWRWMPGMLVALPIGAARRILAVREDADGVAWLSFPWLDWQLDASDDLRPDLSDPATRGCVLHLLRLSPAPTSALGVLDYVRLSALLEQDEVAS